MIVEDMSTPVDALFATMRPIMASKTTLQERLRAACFSAQVAPDPTPLSKATGLSPSLCHKYLHGLTSIDRIPGINLIRIADALNVNGRWLTLGEGNPNYQLPRNDLENEVLHLMHNLSPEGAKMIRDVAEARAIQERAAPVTGRFRPAH